MGALRRLDLIVPAAPAKTLVEPLAGEPARIVSQLVALGIQHKSWIFLVVLCAGCRDATRVFRLTNALRHEFTETRMGVSLTDGLILTVTVADSVLAIASCQTQVGVAMRVGQFLQQHDDDLASSQVVNVAFVPGHKDAAVPVRTAHLPIRFSPTKVRAGLAASDSTDAVTSSRLNTSGWSRPTACCGGTVRSCAGAACPSAVIARFGRAVLHPRTTIHLDLRPPHHALYR